MESGHGSDQGLDEGHVERQRDMVAPASSRSLWERIDASKGPGITGRQEDWQANNFTLMSFMKDHELDKTMKGKDPHKNSEDENEQANYRRRDGIVFTTLTRQISETSIEGKTLLTEVMAKFADDQSGEELYEFIVKKMTTMTTEDIREKKLKIKEFSLRSEERPKEWEHKLVNLKALWKEIPETKRGGYESTLVELVLESLPTQLSSYSQFIMGAATADKSILEDFDK